MAMETKRRDGRASDGRMSHVRMPVNALDAAKRAAHARPVERERLRAAAAGTRRAISNGALGDGCVPVEFVQGDGCVQKASLSKGILELELRDGTIKNIEL